MIPEMGQGKNESNFPQHWTYNLRAKRFLASEVKSQTKRKMKTNPVFHAAKINDEPYWSFVWDDLPPHLISWEQTLVRIEKSDDGINWKQFRLNGQPQDDSGYDIAILCNDVVNHGETGIYETRWYNPPDREKKEFYRFLILPQAGQDFLYSMPFN
jgi:hypothetical protein